ncbi:hypothetical protein [Spirosoma montaniterrae]|uniref:Outer membrane protein beta-barrel domain-containing protein n=1 Tax=Spirosoma montaniterrae TaxID=1178516 RepID=A0A1P9X1N5_9BACT|nr:hypothetical protein [Spirosoma montaniterrae]AQG81498.1 hypothetical protein AWR27_20580 [Spirosoma montaniterrae]
MKSLLFTFGLAVITSPTFAQTDAPKLPARWQTTIEMGVLGGRVRPDQPTYGGGGWYYTPIGYVPQRQAGNRIGLTIHTFMGYTLNKHVVTGVATGVDYYNNSAIIPVSGAVRGDLLGLDRRVMPFYLLETGYGFRGPNPHDEQMKGGWLWSSGVGLRISKGNNTGFLVSAGYRHQRSRQVADVDGVQVLSQVEYRQYNRLFFRMGFSF